MYNVVEKSKRLSLPVRVSYDQLVGGGGASGCWECRMASGKNCKIGRRHE